MAAARKQRELEEARKAGIVRPEVDEDGNEINPHIPHYMASAPWYLNPEKKPEPGLKHQRKWTKKTKSDDSVSTTKKRAWYDRGAKVFQAENYRKGACENCGAKTHNAKACPERPRKLGAKWSNKHIAADEKIETIELDYAGKHDRWNGYDAAQYEARERARSGFGMEDDCEENDDQLRRVDEMECFGKVEKRVRTTGDGGSTGTVRNLRIREDTAKYLLNLGAESAHYDPKSRSMRGDPVPDADPNDKFYWGDNGYRNSGQAGELKQLESHFVKEEQGDDFHLQAAPTQAELLYKNFQANRKKLEARTNDELLEKYGNAAANSGQDEIPREVLLGQSERQVEYDRAGRVIVKGWSLPRSKYEEDIYINNHTSVWGSWWCKEEDHQWGYKCCRQTIRNSYCTGTAGIKAVEAAADLMKASIAWKEAQVQ